MGKTEIAAAFPLENPPKEVVSKFGGESNPAASELQETLGGQIWSDVPMDRLNNCAEHISALTFEAFKYYLPAFMTAALEDPFLQSATFVVYALCPLGEMEAYEAGTIDEFDSEQQRVIGETLASLRDHASFHAQQDEIDRAVELWLSRSD